MYIPSPQEVIYITMPDNLNLNQQQQIMAYYRNLFPRKNIVYRLTQQNFVAQSYQPQNSYPLRYSRPVVIPQSYSPYRYARTQPNVSDNRSPPREIKQPNNIQSPSQPQNQRRQSQYTPMKGNSRNVSPFKNSPKKHQTMQLNLKYPDGTSYKGEGRWPNIREGLGILFDEHLNQIYEGQWKNGKKNGQGVQINFYADLNEDRFNYTDFTKLGERWLSYEGEFLDDIWHGQGFLQIANGEKIVGVFKNGLIDGPADFTTKDPFVVNGVWKEGIWQDV